MLTSSLTSGSRTLGASLRSLPELIDYDTLMHFITINQ